MAAEAVKLGILLASSGDFAAEAKLIQEAEALGIESAWVREGAGNPFFALTIAASETRHISLGALIAAFPRSPMVTAQIAWDLARQSNGRFMLGLCAQTSSGGDRDQADRLGRMSEYLESLGAIWNTFQTDARLRYRGKHYNFRLMAPFFNPGPIDHPEIPLFLEGESSALCELAGEAGAGLIMPVPRSSGAMPDEQLSAWKRGMNRGDRNRIDSPVIAPVQLAINAETAEAFGQLRKRYAGMADQVCLIMDGGDAALMRAVMEAEKS